MLLFIWIIELEISKVSDTSTWGQNFKIMQCLSLYRKVQMIYFLTDYRVIKQLSEPLFLTALAL